ncbi:hypothetical protein RND81_05G226500 [Saponaria officinalis]|uniref:GTP cyclohydrolase 1 n=1 Tax=Saponaria officinalis TaxID=3572 RepID=A0AAW1L0Y6_SAPOF
MSMGSLQDYHCDNIDIKKAQIEEAVRVLLQGLGEDINRDGLIKTPHRVAKAFLDGTRGYKQNVDDIVQGALFSEAGLANNKVGHAGGVGGLVIVRDLDLFSYCESCLLPFHVKCHVGYVPSGHCVVGLSKLSRVAEVFAKRLQHPQRLADEICAGLQQTVDPSGVAVVLQCFHIHCPNGFLKTEISAGSGVFEDENDQIWREFFSLLKFRMSIADKNFSYWCPSVANVDTVSSDMGSAVTSIIRALGEDPSRKELVGTPSRFVKWLMNFKHCNINTTLDEFISKKSDIPTSNKQIYSELNLRFLSQCEHHLLPFHGVVHIGYFGVEEASPTKKSFLELIVQFYGFKLQVQERFTRQIAEIAAPVFGGDIIVVAEASHTCMISRGIEKFGSNTATVAVLGQFSTDATARALFLERLSRLSSPL